MWSLPLAAQNGQFDPTFDAFWGGYTQFDPTYMGNEFPVELIVDPQGRLVAGGFNWAGSNTNCWVCRVEANGGMDMSFGPDGCVDVNLCISNDALADMVVLPDSRIMGIGTESLDDESVVFRLNEDGALDTTWNHTGMAGHGLVDEALGSHAMAMLPNGGVLAMGGYYVGNYERCLLWAFLPSGEVDTTFHGTGTLQLQLSYPEWLEYRYLAVRSDGKFLIAGREYSTYGGTLGAWNAVRRFNPDGGVDSTFAVNGLLRDTVAGFSLQYPTMLLLPDDRILVYGSWYDGFDVRIGLIRLLSDGTRDPSFGQNGAVLLTLPGAQGFSIGGGVLLADGRVALPVWSTAYTNTNVIAINPDGTQDMTFGTGGMATGPLSHKAQYLAVQGDSAIVVLTAPDVTRLGAMRYRVDPLSTSVPTSAPMPTFSLLPVPNGGQDVALFHTKGNGAVQGITVTDISGRSIPMSTVAQGDRTVLSGSSQLPQGCYVVRVSTNAGTSSARMIID